MVTHLVIHLAATTISSLSRFFPPPPVLPGAISEMYHLLLKSHLRDALGEPEWRQGLCGFRFGLFLGASQCPVILLLIECLSGDSGLIPPLQMFSSNNVIHRWSLAESTSLAFDVLQDREREKTDNIVWAPGSNCAWNWNYFWTSQFHEPINSVLVKLIGVQFLSLATAQALD